jgi:segregation and condensation protein B
VTETPYGQSDVSSARPVDTSTKVPDASVDPATPAQLPAYQGASGDVDGTVASSVDSSSDPHRDPLDAGAAASPPDRPDPPPARSSRPKRADRDVEPAAAPGSQADRAIAHLDASAPTETTGQAPPSRQGEEAGARPDAASSAEALTEHISTSNELDETTEHSGPPVSDGTARPSSPIAISSQVDQATGAPTSAGSVGSAEAAEPMLTGGKVDRGTTTRPDSSETLEGRGDRRDDVPTSRQVDPARTRPSPSTLPRGQGEHSGDVPRISEADLVTAHPESLDLIGAPGGTDERPTSGQVDLTTARTGSAKAPGGTDEPPASGQVELATARTGSAKAPGGTDEPPTSGQVDLTTGEDGSSARSDVDQTMRGPDSAGSEEIGEAAADVSTSRDLDEVPAYPDADRAPAAAGGSASEGSDRTDLEGPSGPAQVAGRGRTSDQRGRSMARPAVDDEGEELADAERLRSAVEAVLLVVDAPTSSTSLAQVLARPVAEVDAALRLLQAEYDAGGRGLDLREVADGWRLYSREDFARYVERFVLDGQQARLTQAALETLAVIAYRQPVTRSRIAGIRGVSVDAVMRTLLTRGLVEECGADPDTGGGLYRTTRLFLEKVGLRSLDELPSLAPLLPDTSQLDDVAVST